MTKITSLLRWPSRRSTVIEPKLKRMDKAANVHYKITKRLYALKGMLRKHGDAVNAMELHLCYELHTRIKDMYFCAEVLLRIHLRGVNGNPDGDYWYDPIRAWRRREESGETVPEDEKIGLRVLLDFWVDEASRLKDYDFLPRPKQTEFGGLEEMGNCHRKLLKKLWQDGEEIGWKGFERERIELMNREDAKKHGDLLAASPRPAMIAGVSG